MDRAPIGGPSISPHREGAGPPLPWGGGRSRLWPQKGWKRPDRAGVWVPHRGLGVEVVVGQ
jgi:hypothetical protein